MFDDTFDVDEAADTQRFSPIDPGATSIYDLGGFGDGDITARYRVDRSLIRQVRQDVVRLRDALISGWDVGPELAHEERRLAALSTGNVR